MTDPLMVSILLYVLYFFCSDLLLKIELMLALVFYVFV